ncbi:MAG: hypothetical protein JSS98_03450 [Bacteroidetes bacterium]|nr:hypothetical protein [Bacteroidota bacterium]
MILDIGIGFVTGRRHFQKVLTTYINNWVEYGLLHNKNIRLHLLVAYDLKYAKTQIGDYRNIDPELAKMVHSIHFYGRKAIETECAKLISSGLLNEAEAELIFGEGYAKKRNAVLYFAKKNNLDRLIFLDDDEYPLSVLQNKEQPLLWMGQSVVGTHIKFSEAADITHGHHCGYISPIPCFEFNKTLTEYDFKNFIEAISNEIISWSEVKKNIFENKGVTYADPEKIYNQPFFEVKEMQGMKFISGANLCFNLRSIHSLPPFYNPPGARGEDTFMSTELSDFKVMKVPCYTFHDGFLQYKNILNGVLPIELQAVDSKSPAVVSRFVKAAIGWVRYKPLMLYITQNAEYEKIIEVMSQKLAETIPKLCAYFNTDLFSQIPDELRHYHKNVKRHYQSFQNTKNVWAKLMVNFNGINQ